MQHIDVVINVYGKPWQTLCTLKSLMKYSGQWIDKIYFIEEKHHAFNDEVLWTTGELENIIHYKPKEFYGVSAFKVNYKSITGEQRYGFRYQYGIDNSDKKYVFITHNDILYSGDIIGNMLSEIEDNTGIGLIGQCWNCPLFKSGNCSPEKFNSYFPTYDEVWALTHSFAPARTDFYAELDKENVRPVPECRLNEFACLINREDAAREDTPFFGAMEILDTGCLWFKHMIHKGYRFKNYDINKDSDHGYFSKIESRNYEGEKNFFVSGYPTQLNEKYYWEAEERAMEYYQNKL